MSMNFSEFKRLLGTDPASLDPDYQAARRSDPEFVQAAAESDAFEQRLSEAIRLPVPAKLCDGLKGLAAQNPMAGPSPIYRFRYALAATVVLALCAIVLTRQLSPAESVTDYVEHHFGVDGYDLLVQADTPNAGELAAVLASFKLQMSPELTSQVRFVKYCPTPEGMGIHLVLDTEQGLVTVIFMPGLEVQEGERFAFHDMAGELFNLPGQDISAVIVAQPERLDSAQQGVPGETLGAALAVALQHGVWRQTVDV